MMQIIKTTTISVVRRLNILDTSSIISVSDVCFVHMKVRKVAKSWTSRDLNPWPQNAHGKHMGLAIDFVFP